MKKVSSIVLVACVIITLGFVLQSFVRKTYYTDNGEVVSAKEIGEFNAISVEGAMDVYVTQGAVSEAKMEGDADVLSKLEFVKKDDELIVRYKDDEGGYSSTSDVKIYVSSPAIQKFNVAGSGSITGTNQFTTDNALTIAVAGSGLVSVNISASKLDVDIAGSGDIDVDGFAKHLDISIAGSGDFKGEAFNSENVKVSISGSGDALFNASGKIDANIAGSGDVLYGGKPAQVNADVAGSGSVKER